LAIALGIAAAVLWGTADFLARFSTRQIGTFRTLLFMQAVGVGILTVWLTIDGELAREFSAHSWALWGWVALSGTLSSVATLGFYRSLEIGTLSIVAPVCSVYPALTLLLSMYAGERVSKIHIVGIFISLVGVVLAATSFKPLPVDAAGSGIRPRGRLTRGVGLALMASTIYGINFWLIGYEDGRKHVGLGSAIAWVDPARCDRGAGEAEHSIAADEIVVADCKRRSFRCGRVSGHQPWAAHGARRCRHGHWLALQRCHCVSSVDRSARAA
jgi:uncharacterized membrane protein